ncbi:related to multidrug resistant protein [Fusarium torulosum]|uniref:Related to multidrug resistant protein n=1 Tax=Fusarium torulosum TaxID=33205 RepID=A0AAE8M4N4_9HYPO|nr:related to multidrug resistant protein [Fusarium torulosum]
MSSIQQDSATPRLLEAKQDETNQVRRDSPPIAERQSDDIETQRQFEKDDPDALDWDGPEDPDNPMNWPPRKRTAHIILIALVQLVSNLASTMFAPAGKLLMHNFDFSSRTLSSLSVSIYVLGFAISPLIWAPLSEVYGRFPIYIISTIIFVGFVLGCAFSTSLAMFMVFRLLSGCGGAASLALSGGTLADLVPRQQRGKWMALIAIGPIMGPTIGPVVGGFVGQNIGWRWIFRLMAICIGALIPLAAYSLRETYAPVILLQKENQRRMSLGLPLVSAGRDVPAKLKRSILRPFKLLFLSPVVLFLALYAAFCFGLMFLLLTTFSNVFSGQYGFDMGITGLCYLGMGVGTLGGLIAQGKFSDNIMRKRAEQRGGEPKPEDRIPLMAYLSWTIPVGMFWYGWSTDEKAHWIVPIIGSAFVGIGFIFVVMPSMIYLVDCFGPEAAASALAAHTVLRSVTAAFLPLAGPRIVIELVANIEIKLSSCAVNGIFLAHSSDTSTTAVECSQAEAVVFAVCIEPEVTFALLSFSTVVCRSGEGASIAFSPEGNPHYVVDLGGRGLEGSHQTIFYLLLVRSKVTSGASSGRLVFIEGYI